MPLINVLASGGTCKPTLLKIIDTTGHLAAGGNKCALYHVIQLKPIIESLGEGVVDYVSFDGASNVQKAGKQLSIWFPRITCTHGGEHVVNSVFAGIAKLKHIALMIRTYRRFQHYACGPHHSLGASFAKISAESNTFNRRPIFVPRIVSIRFGSWARGFVTMPRCKAPALDWVACNQKVPLKLKRILQVPT